MKLFNIKNTIVAMAITLFALTGASFAQDYRDWQRDNYGRGGYLPNSVNCPVDTSPKWDPNAQAWGCVSNYPTRSDRNPRNAPNCPVGTGPKWDPAALAWGCVEGYYRNNGNNRRAEGYYRNDGRQYDRNYGDYRQGGYYETNNRSTELLRQAVQTGYSQGYARGQQDRRYGQSTNYNGSQSYGAGDQYQYYFQQGFQRGYQDGYNSTSRYGRRSGNSASILGSVLSTILNMR